MSDEHKPVTEEARRPFRALMNAAGLSPNPHNIGSIKHEHISMSDDGASAFFIRAIQSGEPGTNEKKLELQLQQIADRVNGYFEQGKPVVEVIPAYTKAEQESPGFDPENAPGNALSFDMDFFNDPEKLADFKRMTPRFAGPKNHAAGIAQ